MKKSLIIGGSVLLAVAGLMWAYSIAAITTTASFTGGQTVNVNPNGNSATITSTICPDDVIPFSVNYSVTGSTGGTVLPRTVGFDLTTSAKPVGAPNVASTGFTTSHTFTTASSTFTDTGSMTAPGTLGAYTVHVGSVSGTGGSGGISGGDIVVNFTVADCAPPCTLLNTFLTVGGPICVVFHQPTTVDLTATLKDENMVALSGQTIHFSVDGNFVGDALTDGSGVATISGYDVTGLSVGDHPVTVTFDGVPCPNEPNGYNATNGSGNIGVTYMFLGFQQPINADGSSVFKGGVIPVKIKITDYFGVSIPDASPYVFYSGTSSYPVGTDAEPLANTNGDSGNLMRYDATAQQYIFNWDIRPTTVANGTYQVWVDLGEGSCGVPHLVTLSIQKKGH
jgi:hypothetical protein